MTLEPGSTWRDVSVLEATWPRLGQPVTQKPWPCTAYRGPQPPTQAPATEATPHSTQPVALSLLLGCPLQTAHSTFSGWWGGWGAGTPWEGGYKVEGSLGPWRAEDLLSSCSHGSAAPGCLGDLTISGAVGTDPGLCPGPLFGPSVAPWASPSAVPGEPAFAGCDPTRPGTDGGRVRNPMSSYSSHGVCVPALTREASREYRTPEACSQRTDVGARVT